MDEEIDVRDEVESLAELVRFDYERTMTFIQGVVGVSANLRTIAIGGWFVLTAAAIETERWELALIALFAVILFGVLDAYHGWLYTHALERATEMEGVLQAYAKWIGRPTDRDVATRTLFALRRHRFGQLRAAPRFMMSNLREARPTLVYRWLYPTLVVGAVAVGVAVSDIGVG